MTLLAELAIGPCERADAVHRADGVRPAVALAGDHLAVRIDDACPAPPHKRAGIAPFVRLAPFLGLAHHAARCGGREVGLREQQGVADAAEVGHGGTVAGRRRRACDGAGRGGRHG